jgi:hypothetical protein
MRALVVSGVLVAAAMAGPVSAAAGEADSAPFAAGGKPPPDPSAAPLPGNLCRALAIAAAANNLSADFLARVIRQESDFRPEAVNGARAEGLPQSPAGTAKGRGPPDTFDPFVAIAKSAQRLRDLYREFGNPGLAAAAYSTGADRIRDWLAGRRQLPDETQAYVRIVTGRPPEEWTAGEKGLLEMPNAEGTPCSQTDIVPVRAPSHPIPWTPPVRVAPRIKPWGVELAGGPNPAKALAKYHELQLKYSVASILAGREPQLITRGRIGDMGAVRVRIGTETRAEGIKLCTSLSARGWFCDVLRN